jgi:hypothetical protein
VVVKNEVLRNAIYENVAEHSSLLSAFVFSWEITSIYPTILTGMKGEKGDFGAPGSLGPRG